MKTFNRIELDQILNGAGGGGLKAQIKAAFGLADTDFIDVPVIFDNTDANINARVISPNLVNVAVYGNTCIAPKPMMCNPAEAEEDTAIPYNQQWDGGEIDLNGNGYLDTQRDVFENQFTGSLPGTISVTFLDTWDYLHGPSGGEVHCGSNEKRTGHTIHWWNVWP